MLGGGGEWTRFSNLLGRGILLRITGLNSDAAFLALMLTVGFVLEKNNIWRAIFFVTNLLAFSRAGIIAMLAIVVYWIISGRVRSFSPSRLAKTVAGIAAVIIVLLIIYFNVDLVRDLVARFFERMATISTGADGTSRHMGYLLAALEVCLFSVPIPAKLFGVGLGCAGCMLAVYHVQFRWNDIRAIDFHIHFVPY